MTMYKEGVHQIGSTSEFSESDISIPPSLPNAAHQETAEKNSQLTTAKPKMLMDKYSSSSSSSSLRDNDDAFHQSSLDMDILFSMLSSYDKENRANLEQQECEKQRLKADMAAKAEHLVRWVTQDSAGAILDAAHARAGHERLLLASEMQVAEVCPLPNI